MPTTGRILDGECLAARNGTPFVHLFRTSRCWYVYDVNTNRILQVTPSMWILLRHRSNGSDASDTPRELSESSNEDIADATRAYDSLRANLGVFSAKHPAHLAGFPPEGQQHEKYRSGMEQLILEITENCNLRCRYCAYSGRYPLNRNHGANIMALDLAKAAIDYFLDHSAATETPTIGFYGGEPLLAFGVMRECVEYAAGRCCNARFQITTNGTVLTRDIMEFFVRHSVTLLVSLDGPAPSHDLNRVSCAGHGTWETVLNNLRMTREAYPEYYADHIGIAAVIAPNVDPGRAWKFFEEHREIIGNSVLMCNLVSDVNTQYFEHNAVSGEWLDALETLRRAFYESLIAGSYPLSKVLEGLFQLEFLKIYRREIQREVPTTAPLNGCCLPGTRRLFVDCYGRYHMCERVNPTIPIGSVAGGIDFEEVERLMNEYRQVSEADCCGCWLVRLCPLCFASCAQDSGFTREHKRSICEATRAMFDRTLTDYCEIAEENPAAFQYMDDITVR